MSSFALTPQQMIDLINYEVRGRFLHEQAGRDLSGGIESLRDEVTRLRAQRRKMQRKFRALYFNPAGEE